MNPWNGANAIILSGSDEAVGVLRRFPGAFAVPTVKNDARSIDLALSLVMRTHFSRGDDASAPFGPTLGPDVVAAPR